MKDAIRCGDDRCMREISYEEASESTEYCGILLCQGCLTKLKFEEQKEKQEVTFTNWGV